MGYIFDVVVLLDSDGSCNEGTDGYSLSGTCIRFSCGCSLTVFIAAGCCNLRSVQQIPGLVYVQKECEFVMVEIANEE